MHFLPVDPKVYTRKSDATDPRLGDQIQPCPDPSRSSNGGLVLLGYPDDEGIQINRGRIGAMQGPDSIRAQFYKMTPNLQKSKDAKLQELGNLDVSTLPLAERHDHVAKTVQAVLKNKSYVLSLGGGHDYGYADGKGFLEATTQKKVRPLVINFDAHFDVRSMDKGLSSGTPFYRLLTDFKNFDFACLGMQSQCNSRSHYQWLLKKKASVLLWDEICAGKKGPVESILRFLKPLLNKNRPVYLSVDIDGFSSAYAPGCSQSFATGFTPEIFFPVMDYILKNSDVRVLGIYEVSPPLDLGVLTSRLAALIAHRYYSSLSTSGGKNV